MEFRAYICWARTSCSLSDTSNKWAKTLTFINPTFFTIKVSHILKLYLFILEVVDFFIHRFRSNYLITQLRASKSLQACKQGCKQWQFPNGFPDIWCWRDCYTPSVCFLCSEVPVNKKLVYKTTWLDGCIKHANTRSLFTQTLVKCSCYFWSTFVPKVNFVLTFCNFKV